MATVVDQEFTITLKRIVELLESEEKDDYGILKPSEYAFKTAMNLVVETYEMMGSSFPKASASTDHEGGIILAWKNRELERQVRLFCPFSPEKQAYS